MTATPQPPKGTGTAGKALWKRIITDLPAEWELDARDLEILGHAARLTDRISDLAAAVKTDGVMIDGPAGPRLNPAVSELRQSEAALVRHLSQIDLEPDAKSQTATSRGARAAAHARWANAGPSRRNPSVAG